MAGLSICNVQEVYYPLALFMGCGVVERGGAAKKSSDCPKYMFWSQSYKHFMIVIYDPRVLIWSVFKSGTTLES